MSLTTIKFPYAFIPQDDKGRPVSSGYIYIGTSGLDPTILANQIPIYFVQESGATIVGIQPIRTSAGGVPTYNGANVQVKVDGDYSIAVLNSSSSQVYYSPSQNGQNITPTIPTIAALKLLTGVIVGQRALVWRNGIPTPFEAEATSSPNEFGRIASTGTPAIDWVVSPFATGFINAGSYGVAVGNADTVNAAALQSLVDLLKNVGGTIIFASGTYNIYNLVMTSAQYDGIQFKGVSASRTALNFTSTAISIEMASVQNSTFEDMIIDSPNSNTMIYMDLCTQVAFKKVRHTAVGNNGPSSKGYHLIQSLATLFDEVSYGGATTAETGFLITDDSDATTLRHCYAKGGLGCVNTISLTSGVTHPAHLCTTIIGGVIGGGSNASLVIGVDGVTSNVNVSGVYFETGVNAVILGNAAGNFKASQIDVSGNFFDGFTGNNINANCTDNCDLNRNTFSLGSQTNDILVNADVTKNQNLNAESNYLTLPVSVSAFQKQIRYQTIVNLVPPGVDSSSVAAAFMTDTGETWTVNQFVGKILNNVTTGARAIITANTADTVTGTLRDGARGGAVDNTWNATDSYTIVDFSRTVDRITNIPNDSFGSVWNPGSIADGASEGINLTVTTAELTSMAIGSFNLDLQGLTISAAVTAANIVRVTLTNNTGGAVDLGSGVVRCIVIRYS